MTTLASPATRPSLDACHGCPALCCHDMSQPMDRPATRADVRELLWQLRYDTVQIYVRNGHWHYLTKGRCLYLDANNLCTIYQRRPARCRNHHPDNCERYGAFYDVLFTRPEELEAYLRDHPLGTTRRRGRSGRRRSGPSAAPARGPAACQFPGSDA